MRIWPLDNVSQCNITYTRYKRVAHNARYNRANRCYCSHSVCEINITIRSHLCKTLARRRTCVRCRSGDNSFSDHKANNPTMMLLHYWRLQYFEIVLLFKWVQQHAAQHKKKKINVLPDLGGMGKEVLAQEERNPNDESTRSYFIWLCCRASSIRPV